MFQNDTVNNLGVEVRQISRKPSRVSINKKPSVYTWKAVKKVFGVFMLLFKA
jgi:hypothetical protein